MTNYNLGSNVRETLKIGNNSVYTWPIQDQNGNYIIWKGLPNDVQESIITKWNNVYSKSAIIKYGVLLPIIPGKLNNEIVRHTKYNIHDIATCDNDSFNQSLRQWIRTIISIVYDINTKSGDCIYYALAMNLITILNNYNDNDNENDNENDNDSLDKIFTHISLCMLNKLRYNENIMELAFLRNGNFPDSYEGSYKYFFASMNLKVFINIFYINE